MKPILANLAPEKKPARSMAAVIVALLACAALGITATTAYEYRANQKVITEYQSRINSVRQQAEQIRQAAAARTAGYQKKMELTQSDFDSVAGLIEKSLFPVVDVLTELEKLKPDHVEITEVIFSDSLNQITIRAASFHASSMSDFIALMGRSNRFNARLTRKQIDADYTISLELAAGWPGIHRHDTP